MTSARLLGSWELVTYEAVNPDGSIERPYGKAIGRLTYDDRGNMSGQVMRPDRAPTARGDGLAERVRDAYAGYVAYFGTYEVSPRGDVVVHYVEGALNPSWVGGRQVRRLAFDGDLLVLEADVPRGEGIVRHVLRWKKRS